MHATEREKPSISYPDVNPGSYNNDNSGKVWPLVHSGWHVMRVTSNIPVGFKA